MSKTAGQRLGLLRRVSPYILPVQSAFINKAIKRSKMEYASSAWIGVTPPQKLSLTASKIELSLSLVSQQN